MNASPVLMTSCSKGYLRLLENWLLHLEPTLHERVALIALDDETASFAGKHGLRVAAQRQPADLNALWVLRLECIVAELRVGRDVIHSDLDAVWIKDPRPLLSATAADLCFSQGTFWPEDVHRALGSVLCCGFFFAASNPRTLAFADKWVAATHRQGDDQVALNQLLLASGLRWNAPCDYQLVWQGYELQCYRAPQRCVLADDLSVALLPHHQFLRVMTTSAEIDSAYVVHPLAEKTGDASEAVLASLGLWRLD